MSAAAAAAAPAAASLLPLSAPFTTAYHTSSIARGELARIAGVWRMKAVNYTAAADRKEIESTFATFRKDCSSIKGTEWICHEIVTMEKDLSKEADVKRGLKKIEGIAKDVLTGGFLSSHRPKSNGSDGGGSSGDYETEFDEKSQAAGLRPAARGFGAATPPDVSSPSNGNTPHPTPDRVMRRAASSHDLSAPVPRDLSTFMDAATAAVQSAIAVAGGSERKDELILYISDQLIHITDMVTHAGHGSTSGKGKSAAE